LAVRTLRSPAHTAPRPCRSNHIHGRSHRPELAQAIDHGPAPILPASDEIASGGGAGPGCDVSASVIASDRTPAFQRGARVAAAADGEDRSIPAVSARNQAEDDRVGDHAVDLAPARTADVIGGMNCIDEALGTGADAERAMSLSSP